MGTSTDTASEDKINDKDMILQEMDPEKHGHIPNLEEQAPEPPFSVFSKGTKIWIIFLVCVSALISPFGATTFLPALNVLSDVLDISATQVNISITTYMVC
jgi:hypothetical protein